MQASPPAPRPHEELTTIVEQLGASKTCENADHVDGGGWVVALAGKTKIFRSTYCCEQGWVQSQDRVKRGFDGSIVP